jgi:hypothetical protein
MNKRAASAVTTESCQIFSRLSWRFDRSLPLADHLAGQISQGRWIEPEKPEKPVGDPRMQDRKSRELVYPEPMTIDFPMLPGVNESGVRRIGYRAGNGVRCERTALEGIKDPFSGQRFDYARGVADVHQVRVLRLDC